MGNRREIVLPDSGNEVADREFFVLPTPEIAYSTGGFVNNPLNELCIGLVAVSHGTTPSHMTPYQVDPFALFASTVLGANANAALLKCVNLRMPLDINVTATGAALAMHESPSRFAH
jgi:hypothetical protein